MYIYTYTVYTDSPMTSTISARNPDNIKIFIASFLKETGLERIRLMALMIGGSRKSIGT